MNQTILEIKKGIKVHYIKTDKYKTDLSVVTITTPLNKDTVTKNTLIPAILRRGSENFPTQEEINKNLENMYGAIFDCGIDKIGDNQVLKFYIESVNDKYLPQKEDVLNKSIDALFNIVFNPYIENNEFKKEYIDTEKNNVKQLIDGKIDNKDQYAWDRCIEEMYKDDIYGLYKYGSVEDLEKINSKELKEYYDTLINSSKIDIYVSGEFNQNELEEYINKNEIITSLKEREPDYIINNEETEEKEKTELQTKEEKMNVTQGKLVLGYDIFDVKKDERYIIAIYNVILGESATSKLFQNVREKASLAYSARSNYIRQKNNIYIRCGIEINNYEKALEIIKQQVEDMKNGDFTEEDIENAKKYMVAGIKTVQEEQDSEIIYYIGQELSGTEISFEEYIDNIQKVTKEQVIDAANKVQLNTIYFLKNND